MPKRILLVEDDAALSTLLRINLVHEGFEVECVADGGLAPARARAFCPDLILLDLMLPGLDGFKLLETLGQGRRAPMIVLSVRGQRADKLRGFRLGADDYVTKPFDRPELIARIHAILRRSSPEHQRLELGDVVIDFAARSGTRHGVPIHFTDLEFELLRYLAERRSRVVYRDELLRAVWGYGETPLTRSVDNTVARLRRKIEPHNGPSRYIHTVRGHGYVLTPDGELPPPA
jgi:two-component system phosphate regulon response regulator PhoB